MIRRNTISDSTNSGPSVARYLLQYAGLEHSTYNASPLGRPSRTAVRVVLQLRHVVDYIRDLLVCRACDDAELLAHAILTTCAIESEDLLVGSRD